MSMNQGLKSLWSSLRAFVIFWTAFVCATICNSLIPFDALKESIFFKHLITQSMVDLRVKVVNTIMTGGLYNLKDVVITMIQNATINFLAYFKEIFVIVTVFHFTPLVSGKPIFLTLIDKYKLMSTRLVFLFRSGNILHDSKVVEEVSQKIWIEL